VWPQRNPTKVVSNFSYTRILETLEMRWRRQLKQAVWWLGGWKTHPVKVLILSHQGHALSLKIPQPPNHQPYVQYICFYNGTHTKRFEWPGSPVPTFFRFFPPPFYPLSFLIEFININTELLALFSICFVVLPLEIFHILLHFIYFNNLSRIN